MCHSVLEEFAEKEILRRAQGNAMSVEVHCSVAAELESQGRLAVIHHAVPSSRSLFQRWARTSEAKSGHASVFEALLKSPDRQLLDYSVEHKRCQHDHIVSCRPTADRSSCHWNRTEATLEIAASMSGYNPMQADIRRMYEDGRALP